MSIDKLKETIIKKVNDSSDYEILDIVLDLLQQGDIPYTMTEEEAKSVQESLAQIERGEVIDHEEAMKQTDKWLEDEQSSGQKKH